MDCFWCGKHVVLEGAVVVVGSEAHPEPRQPLCARCGEAAVNFARGLGLPRDLELPDYQLPDPFVVEVWDGEPCRTCRGAGCDGCKQTARQLVEVVRRNEAVVFGARVTVLRQRRRLTLAEFARRSKLDVDMALAVELGAVRHPPQDVLDALTHALAVDAPVLWAWAMEAALAGDRRLEASCLRM
jgi:hypothetical protein